MLIIAHRGSSDKAPENTLPAILQAISDGADGIEIDVQLTKDQQVVVFHDEWINRTTNGQGFICDLTYAQLSRLDAGAWFHPKYKGTKIPLLTDVLELAKEHALPLHIELKNNLIPYPQIEKKVIELVQQIKMEEQVIISSFRRASLEKCQQLAPQIKRGFLCWSNLDTFFQTNEWEQLKLYSIHPHLSLVTDKVHLLQQQGYKIFPYNIEKRYELFLCHHYGVDGIFTNSPKAAKQLLEQHRF